MSKLDVVCAPKVGLSGTRVDLDVLYAPVRDNLTRVLIGEGAAEKLRRWKFV